MAEVLKRPATTTALIGKWGLGEPGSTGLPRRQGFDTFYGYLNQVDAHNYWPGRSSGVTRSASRWKETPSATSPACRSTARQYSPDLFIREADLLRAEHPRPFFLYLSLTLPHANNERGNHEGNGMEIPPDSAALRVYDGVDWPSPQKNHAAMITKLDEGRRAGAGDPGRAGSRRAAPWSSSLATTGPTRKAALTRPSSTPAALYAATSGPFTKAGIRVPAIACWPGQIKANTVSDQVWAFWDVLPTLADLVEGAATPAEVDGVSIAPVLLGQAQRRASAPLLGVPRTGLQAGRPAGGLEGHPRGSRWSDRAIRPGAGPRRGPRCGPRAAGCRHPGKDVSRFRAGRLPRVCDPAPVRTLRLRDLPGSSGIGPPVRLVRAGVFPVESTARRDDVPPESNQWPRPRSRGSRRTPPWIWT